MVEVLIGIISGIVTGGGMGGGTILILLLTLFTGMEQHIAQASNIVFFIPTALAAIWMNIKNKKVNFKLGLITIVSGMLGAVIRSNFSKSNRFWVFKKIFWYFSFFYCIKRNLFFGKGVYFKKKKDIINLRKTKRRKM